MVLPLQSKEVEITINANNAEMLANYDDENGLFIFRGVPYAKPPVGELRWKSPQPVEEKSQIDARSFKPGCMQDTYITCLLYTSPSPRDQRGSRMPSSA